MRLSLAVLAYDSATYVEPLLQAASAFADEIVVGVDSSSSDTTEEICRRYADKLFRLEPIGTSERALAWLNDRCSGEWILRLDDDELPSAPLVAALPRLIRDRDYTHYWLPRRWVIGADGSRWISQDPWWPDWQLRLFRNVRSLVTFPGHLHSDYEVQGAGGYFAEGPLYHLDLIVQSEERRRRKMEQYERISRGNSMSHYYFPDESSVATRAIPAGDLPRAAVDDASRRGAPREPPGSAPLVSLGEMRRAERKGGEHPAELFRATIECLDAPAEMTIGELRSVELRVRNDGSCEWPGPGLGLPDVTIAYHWYDAAGSLHEWEGLRTRLPLTTRPGETVTAIVPVQAPWRLGRYRLRWDALVPLVAWFSDHGLRSADLEIEVRRAADDPPYVDQIAEFLDASTKIPGWFRGDEAKALAIAAYALPEDAVVVEIGSFLGSGTVLLAGSRKLRGSGKVHAIDPFDCSGDAFSAPIYREIVSAVGGGSLRERFEENMRRFGLSDWTVPHTSGAVEAAATWSAPIDLLILDGDQSYRGARAAYESWARFLKPGGILAVHNTAPRVYAPDHDGNRRLALEELAPPRFLDARRIGSTTFARKAANPSA